MITFSTNFFSRVFLRTSGQETKKKWNNRTHKQSILPLFVWLFLFFCCRLRRRSIVKHWWNGHKGDISLPSFWLCANFYEPPVRQTMTMKTNDVDHHHHRTHAMSLLRLPYSRATQMKRNYITKRININVLTISKLSTDAVLSQWTFSFRLPTINNLIVEQPPIIIISII